VSDQTFTDDDDDECLGKFFPQNKNMKWNLPGTYTKNKQVFKEKEDILPLSQEQILMLLHLINLAEFLPFCR